MPVETSFNINKEGSELTFTPIIIGTKNHVDCARFTENTVGAFHNHPITGNAFDDNLNATPSPDDILLALEIGRGGFYSKSDKNKNIYVIRVLKKTSKKELKGIEKDFHDHGKEIISLSNIERVKLMKKLGRYVNIERLL